MKKRIIFIIIALFIVAAVVSFYLAAMPLNVTDSSRSIPELRTAKKFQWIKYWAELDLAVVKRQYQPYSVAEMREMWNDKLVVKYGGAERLKQAIGKAGDVYPQDTYLARMLELGRPFWVYWKCMSSTERAAYLDQQGLPPNATWAVYEEMLLKNDVVYSINFWRSKQQDPYMNGTLPSRFDESCKPNSDE